MASITSLMNSSSMSSIYGTRNVLSGLASGMDTETMIENAVSGIKKKIQSLYQKRTKVEWQQEAYRSIIDKAVNFNTKYTSYTSKTNLLSNSFFTNAVITAVNGTYADKVTASGKTSSDIKINAVKQMATSASYTVNGSAAFGGDFSTITGGAEFDLMGSTNVSTISGSLTLQYGGSNGNSFNLSFGELENIDEVTVYDADGNEVENPSNAEKLAQAIRNKLGEQNWTRTKNGAEETVKGSDVIDVQVDDDGNIKFTDKTTDGNNVYISSAAGYIKDTLGVSPGDEEDTLIVSDASLSKSMSTRDYLSDKTLTLSFNGTSKTINMGDVLDKVDFSADDVNGKFVNALQDEIDSAFGKGKVNVSQDEDGVLSFKATENGSTLALSGTAVSSLGFKAGDANHINTSKTLRDLLGARDSYDFKINGVTISANGDTTLERLINSINSNADAGVKVSYSKLTNEFKFTANETGSNSKIEFSGLAAEVFNPGSGVTSSDDFAKAYGLGDDESKYVTFHSPDGVFSYSNNMSGKTIQEVVDDLNGSLFQGTDYIASYDEHSGKIVATNKNTNETFDIKVTRQGEDGEPVEYKPTSVSAYTAGTDAVMDVEINGMRFENLTRSNNSFDIDGMTINVKDTFSAEDVKEGEEYKPITFETTTDTDKIIDAIRSFVNDYNEMVTEIKNAYSTQPLKNSNGNRYDPLTAEDEEGMTESAIAAYNENAKTGLLFGDTTLSSFYSKLLNAIAPGGSDGQTLREIGIGTSYNNGLTTLSLDEDKLRTTLESNPDKVKSAFTKTIDGGSSSNGLMQTLQNTLNTYVKTTGEPKGALITKAGSVKAPTSLNSNSLNTQINNIDTQIKRWQDKMSAQIDRYTTQFSRLEQLVAQMNSQASAFAGLMGGDSGY